jgi:DNA invertase Pin-like site-specific DNA recombinase
MARRFVDELIALHNALCPSASAKERRDFERGIRQRFGGERHYVDRATAKVKTEKLGEELAKGTPVKQAIKAAGLSRTSGYRVLSRKWNVRPE